MALPHQIEKLEDVAEPHREHYKKTDDGKFVLDVTGGEDVSGLKRSLESERENLRKTARERDEYKDKHVKLSEQHEALLKNNVPKDNITALENSYNERITGITKEKDTKIESLSGTVNRLLVDNVAQSMASELAVKGSEAVLLPHIRSRLTVEEKDGTYVTRVLDKDGKPSASTIDDLKKEIASQPAFAPVLSGSNASGGGATGGRPGGGATGKKPDFTKATAAEVADWLKSNKVGHE